MYSKLINIIKEEIEEIIISEEEYNAEDVVDFDNINLRKEFNKLNNILFNGEVPEIPLKWSKRKTALGHVRQKINRATGQIFDMELWISTFFEVTYRQFLNVLAHEMIHVLLNTQNSNNTFDPHGREFMREAERINSLGLGFNITKTNGEDLALSKQTKERISGQEKIAIVFDFDGQYSVAVTTPRVYKRDHYNLLNTLQHVTNKGRFKRIEVNVIKSSNPELMRYRQQRTFERKVSHAPISDELLNELLDDDVLRTVVITPNNREDSKNGQSGLSDQSGLVAEEVETILIS